jgi:hypothetical protein
MGGELQDLRHSVKMQNRFVPVTVSLNSLYILPMSPLEFVTSNAAQSSDGEALFVFIGRERRVVKFGIPRLARSLGVMTSTNPC